MPCYSPLKGWKDIHSGGIRFDRDGPGPPMEVACGQCLGCRLDRARMFAIRISHEAQLWETHGGNCFVTLTYRDKNECTPKELKNGLHVPDDWSLNKKHFQDFMKRLRKRFAPQRIRFYACGEYGNRCKHNIDLERVGCPLCRLGRPHFHACLFNCGFPDLESYGTNECGDLRYTSPLLESIWKYGFVDVGELNFESAGYVARYCLKKVTGTMADDHYHSIDLDGVMTFISPEFVLMSRRPGIGRDWYEKYKDDVFPSDECPVVGRSPIKKVPRYYEELFRRQDPMTLEEIKKLRREFKRAHAEDYTPERLMDKYKVKKKQIETLSRSL